MDTTQQYLSDEAAVRLVSLLVDYARDAAAADSSADVPALTVRELVGDIVASLPHATALPVGTRDMLDPDDILGEGRLS